MRASIVVVGLLVGVVMLGCETRVSLGARCTSSAECPASLTCSVGRCRTACTSASQCGEGRRCIAAADGTRACSTAPDDSCVRVEDCGDPTFSLCVNARCQTTCTSDTQCAGGVCVAGGCAEQPDVDAAEVGAVALGASVASTTRVGSFVVVDPEAPESPLTLSVDEGLMDVAIVVEDASSEGLWVSHVATMQRDGTERGVPTRIDVDHRGLESPRTALVMLDGAESATVAAEPMPDGQPAYLWLTNDPFASPTYPDTFARFARGNGATAPMNGGGNRTQRIPGRAFIATGFGPMGQGPAWGFRVVDDGVSEIQTNGPGAGMDVARVTLEPTDRGRVDAVGSFRSYLVRSGAGTVRFVRLVGDESLMAAAFELDTPSSCAPGLADRNVVRAGNYVIATCDGADVVLRTVTCAASGSGLEPCTVLPALTITEPLAPLGVSLETWPGGVVLVVEDAEGIHVRPIAQIADTLRSTIRYEGVVPHEYRVDALTDYTLAAWSANTAWRDGAGVLVIAGLYADDNDIAEVRIGLVEVTATP
ncbi:MAG: hypothetical protein J0L92_05545 [Deltaproteobacteria bacterium]|nr:hypothetical protein [Deltaproteobacteria bacterium]